ncbi:MAG: hypothetical protein K2M12_06680, partial [Muribaculaceae bacterium]|nr:hypothetical protein [Muribaculaceae bacterium]
MKNLILIAFAIIGLASCSDNDEPTPRVYLQVAEITNGSTETQTITYDAKGRVSKYVASYADETVTSTYTYPSDNAIEFHTCLLYKS